VRSWWPPLQGVAVLELLELFEMDRVVEIDYEDLVATQQPGSV